MTEVLARGSGTSRRVTSTSRIPSSAVWPGQLAALAGAERLPTASVARTNASAVANARLRNRVGDGRGVGRDRKSTRLNSSHVKISYAVFCLKKKKKKFTSHTTETQ